MKLALISDLHGVKNCIPAIDKIISDYKVNGIVISGDITHLDETSYLDWIFQTIEKHKVEAFMIWGNSDLEAVRSRIMASPHNINLIAKKFGGNMIAGMGESDEPQLIDPLIIKDAIFVTHKPPLKTNIKKVFTNAPKFHICGHLHNVESVTKYPSTTLIQVPTLQNSRFALFDPAIGSVEFLSV